MVFHRAKIKPDETKVRLSGTTLDQVKFTKFLGVIIDDKLTFTNHISYIKNKIAKGMGIIIKARKYLNKSTLIQLYNTYIFPYLIYCVEIWGNACDSHLDPIIKLQKKILRIITFSTYTAHTEPLCFVLNTLPFRKLVTQRIGLQMFKYANNFVPISINDLFIKNEHVHEHNTRQRSNLRQPVGKQEYMYRNFSFMGVYIWNHIINKTNINIHSPYHTFKYTLKKHLLHNEMTFRII